MGSLIKKTYTILTYYFPFLVKIIEYLYYYLNNLVANKSVYLKNKNDGEKILNNLTKDNKYYYVLIDKGIGDTVIVASYAHHLKEKYHKDIAFIVLKSHADVVKQFDYIKKIIPCSKEDFNKIVTYISSSGIYENNIYKYAFFKMKISKNGKRNWSSAIWNKKMILSDRYKKYVFDFPLDIPPYSLKNGKTESNKIIKQYGIPKKSIVIVPYAYTVNNLKEDFWLDLVKELKNNGYIIYTNIGNPKKEQPIKDTRSLNISLDELFKIAPNIDYFIANRCGLCEFLALSSPKMIVINDNSKNYDRWDDVNNFSSKKTIKNVFINKHLKEDIINLIEGERK